MKPSAEAQERRNANITRLTKELRFLELADNTEDVYYSLDGSSGAMLYISPAYERLWGFSCESLYANPESYIDAVHLADRDAVLARLGGEGVADQA